MRQADAGPAGGLGPPYKELGHGQKSDSGRWFSDQTSKLSRRLLRKSLRSKSLVSSSRPEEKEELSMVRVGTFNPKTENRTEVSIFGFSVRFQFSYLLHTKNRETTQPSNQRTEHSSLVSAHQPNGPQ